MADIILSIDDAKLDRVIHALCAPQGLEETGANAKVALFDYLKRLVWRIETQEAETTAAALVVPDEALEV